MEQFYERQEQRMSPDESRQGGVNESPEDVTPSDGNRNLAADVGSVLTADWSLFLMRQEPDLRDVYQAVFDWYIK